MGRRRSPVGLIVLVLATAAVAVAVILATGGDLAGAPGAQTLTSVGDLPTRAPSAAAPGRAASTPSRLSATPTRAAPASGQVTEAEALAMARADSLKSLGMEMLEARVDEVTAELMSADAAGKRLEYRSLEGGQVWWVHVRGYFRYVGTTSSADTPFATFEARERFFAYDARTGELLVQRIPGDSSSEMPVEKRVAGATYAAHDQAVAKGLIPADTPTPEPKSCPEGPDQGGYPPIRPFWQGRTVPAGLSPTNYALVQADSGKRYTVYAGSKADDPQQGLVLVSEQVPDPCAEAKGLAPKFQAVSLTTPFHSGPVRVYRIEAGNQVILETPERLRVRLNFATGQFGPVEQGPLPPTPTPVEYKGGSPAPGGTAPWKLEPKSARVEQGKAYPFKLSTHCGVDQYVDFDGSAWDLDDPAWFREDELGPFYAIGYNDQEGTMTLVDADHAVFAYGGVEIHYKRHVGDKYFYPCA